MSLVDELVKNGFVKTGYLNYYEIEKINEYLNLCTKYNGHVRRGNSQDTSSGPSTCFSLEDIIRCPLLLEIGLEWTKLAEEYLGPKIYMYSMNVFETYPTEAPPIGYIQEFHRDHDDSKFLALFIYLTDVMNSIDGAHEYIKGTHNGKDIGEIERVLGLSGTMFMEDGKGLHRGIKPQTWPRRIAWIRWCVSCPPNTYVQDGIQPVSKDVIPELYKTLSDREKELVQLIVR